MTNARDTTLTGKAVRAMQEAVRGVIEDHRRRKQPLAIWQDGKVTMVPTDSVMILRESAKPYRSSPKSGRKTRKH